MKLYAIHREDRDDYLYFTDRKHALIRLVRDHLEYDMSLATCMCVFESVPDRPDEPMRMCEYIEPTWTQEQGYQMRRSMDARGISKDMVFKDPDVAETLLSDLSITTDLSLDYDGSLEHDA